MLILDVEQDLGQLLHVLDASKDPGDHRFRVTVSLPILVRSAPFPEHPLGAASQQQLVVSLQGGQHVLVIRPVLWRPLAINTMKHFAPTSGRNRKIMGDYFDGLFVA